jgi:hypothetical protein
VQCAVQRGRRGSSTVAVRGCRVALNWLSPFGVPCSTAPSQLPLHGPLLLAHSTHHSHSLSLDTTLVAAQLCFTNQPLFCCDRCCTHRLLPSASREGQSGVKRETHSGRPRPRAPNAPCFERASLSESTAELHACCQSLFPSATSTTHLATPSPCTSHLVHLPPVHTSPHDSKPLTTNDCQAAQALHVCALLRLGRRCATEAQ